MAAWGVFYRRPEHRTVLDRFGQAAPRFKVPLSRAILNDPAFSSDPRSHPHFPLANAGSYKAPPSKSPHTTPHPLPPSPPSTTSRAHRPPSLSSPSVSSDSDSLTSFSSPTVSSATSHSQSRGSRVPSPVSSPTSSISPLSTPPKVISKRPPPQRPAPPPVPEILPKSDGADALTRKHALQNNSIPRKGRMKALVRKLTIRHNLDRIDELDETDPFGGSYHHDGPYEATANDITQSTLPRTGSDTAPRMANLHHPKREFDPRSLRLGQHQSTPRVLPVHSETGLSLHLEPGQILQQNTIYSSHASGIAPVPSQPHRQPTMVASITRPDHSRSQSLPRPWPRSLEDSSTLDFPDGSQNRPSSLHAPRKRHFEDNPSDMPNSLPLHHDRDAPPYALHQTEMTVFPPPRYESRLHSSASPRSPQHIQPPTFGHTSRKAQSTESTVPLRGSGHKSVHPQDGPYTMNDMITQTSSSTQNKPFEPPRIRHLPKRLVMPAPLQPRPPQPQYKHPPPEPAAWQDECPDDHYLEGTHFEGKPAMYIEEPRHLRKRSSAFPAKEPIPDHVPMFQDDAVPIMGSSLTKTATEAVETKERTRRRRLSKRKNDI